VLHAAARAAEGRTQATPSMVVVDTHLARGGSNGGATFHGRGGPFGRTKGAKCVVAVDVTDYRWPAVPASMHENETTRVVLDHLAQQGVTQRRELVLVDRGVSAQAADKLGHRHGVEVRPVGWDDKQPVFRPIRHAWRVE
jgi:putative transposase